MNEIEFTKRPVPPKHRGRNAKREAVGVFLVLVAFGLVLFGVLALTGVV